MSARDPGEPAGDRFLGFRTYADDTPRTSDIQAPPAAAAYPAYDELSLEALEPRDEALRDDEFRDEVFRDHQPHDRRRGWPAAAVFAGLALAVGAGVALTRWDLIARLQPTHLASRKAPSPPVAAPIPADGSSAAERPVVASLAARPAASPASVAARPGGEADPLGDTLTRILRDLPSEPAKAAASTATAPSASDRAIVAAAQAPSPPIRASFDCRYPRTYAQRMVCGDPDLAAQDRRMSRAYVAALAAGVPQDQLRAEQGDWQNLREDAARHSPQAVRSIYEQRIEELEALAAGGPG
jgi:uncharacterized protein YecT (DUF1311 family)